jgi:hypothetical protein
MAGRCSCRVAYLMPRQVGGGSLASSQGGVSACPPLSLPMPGVWRTGPTCRREPLFMNQSRCRPSLTDTAGAEESLVSHRRGSAKMSDRPSTIPAAHP